MLRLSSFPSLSGDEAAAAPLLSSQNCSDCCDVRRVQSAQLGLLYIFQLATTPPPGTRQTRPTLTRNPGPGLPPSSGNVN